MSKKPNYLDNYFQLVVYFFGVIALKYLFRLKVRGIENISIKKPIIIIANHRSKLDPFVILSAMGSRNFMRFYPGRYPLAKQFAEHWLLKFPSWLVGCYKIEPRGNLKESLADTFHALDSGYSLIFFPEGKMIREGEQLAAKKGIGYLAQLRDFNILPVNIGHTGSTRQRKLGRMINAEIVFGKIFESKLIRLEYPMDFLHEAIMNKVYELNKTLAGCRQLKNSALGSFDMIAD